MARYGGFEIEHFKPKAQFRKLRHTYKNLLWSCAECNRAKGNRWPSIELQAAGNRFVDPSSEGLGKHVEMDANSAVRHRTQAGWYIVNQLKLNSELHRERRKRRAIRATRYTLLLATIEVQAKDLEELQARGEDVSIETQLLVELKRELTACEEVLKPTLPFNGPLACHACVPPRGVADRSAQLQD